MIDTAALPAFVVASAVLVAIPGPAVLYIVSTGIGRGRASAMASNGRDRSGSPVSCLCRHRWYLGDRRCLSSGVLDSAAYLIYLGSMTLRSEESPGRARR